MKKATCEKQSRIGKEKMESDDWSGVGHAIMGVSYSGGKYNFAVGRELDNELLGLPVGEGLEDFLAKIMNSEKVWTCHVGPRVLAADKNHLGI